jgi:hypothetical protein
MMPQMRFIEIFRKAARKKLIEKELVTPDLTMEAAESIFSWRAK